MSLAQGFPDFPAPAELKDAAAAALHADINQYAITWGAKSLRDALARVYRELYAMQVDPETMLTVTCGSTEAMISTLLAICAPGDEVIVLEPFYENYGPDAILSGATPRYVTALHGTSSHWATTPRPWTLDARGNFDAASDLLATASA